MVKKFLKNVVCLLCSLSIAVILISTNALSCIAAFYTQTISSSSTITQILNLVKNNDGDNCYNKAYYIFYNSQFAAAYNKNFPYPNSGNQTNKVVDNGITYTLSGKSKGCYLYADYVSNYYYGFSSHSSKCTSRWINSTAGNMTSEQLKNTIMTYAQAGEHIFVAGNVHSVSFVAYDTNGFYYTDYSSDSNPKIFIHYTTWDQFKKECNSKNQRACLLEFDHSTNSVNETVAIKNDTSRNTYSNTNAILWGWVDKPSSYSVTKIGVRIRRYDSDYANGWSKFEVPSKNYVGSTYMQPYYNINSELNLKLRHATKYFYQIYAVVNGKEYWSAETSFTTTGSHTYSSNWTTTKAATCTEDGSAKRQCTSCVVTETKVLTKLGHNYSNNYTIDKVPTCTTSGSKSRHCTRCSSKSNITEIVPIGHSFSSWQITVKPTCVKEGNQTRKCSACSHVENKVISPKGHSYSSEWTIDKQPSCVETGTKSKHCKSCDSIKEIQSIFPTGHNWSDFTVTTESTVEKEGKSARKCLNSNCKAEETKVLPKLAKDGHTHKFEEWKIVESATCQKDGIKQRMCALCNEKETLTISATGHSFEDWVEKDGTATRKCKACGMIEEEATEIIDNTNTDVDKQLSDSYKIVDNNLIVIYVVLAALLLSIGGIVVYVFVIRKNKK